MTKTDKTTRPVARLPKGMRDIGAAEIRAEDAMIAAVRRVYETYGFEPLETPTFEYTDALGKFLPDQDRPNEGVFSFQDEDEQWLSLRYDLTAPLARYVAQNFATLPKPFRRYAVGPVFRNEKPGPGRFRQFLQCDADTVGTESVAADAENCMMAADALEAMGLRRGQYLVKINSRKVLDGVLETIGIAPGDAEKAPLRLAVLRAMDKLDRLGEAGVADLLGKGRKDESGDFTKGAGLDKKATDKVLRFVTAGAGDKALDAMVPLMAKSAIGQEGFAELTLMESLLRAVGYGPDQVIVDPAIVRGLEYYTGPVYEAELTFSATEAMTGEEGAPLRFGSVGSGGRYDGLVERFTGEKVPATGVSVGVSRLAAALAALGRASMADNTGPVVVLVMDKAELPRYQAFAQTLRRAGIRAEMYLGSAGMKAQMKYADKRGAPCVVIQGTDERSRGEVQIKDLVAGAKLASTIADAKAWKEDRSAQIAVSEERMVEAVREILSRQTS